ncbi:MAG: phosphoglucosamine mutase [Elusimicrobiota bacterium]|nr:phosphoglucosamine mutase [Elusimicrobiota bacterium]
MQLFGTDGIRGDASKFPFDCKTLNIIGKSIAQILGKKGRIFIIRDTRQSGKRIQKHLSAGIESVGSKAILGGVMPTPAASFVVASHKFSCAVAISASHNHYRDNGIKIFNSRGLKLTDTIERKIEIAVNEHLKKETKIKNQKIPSIEDKMFLKLYENFIIDSSHVKNIQGKTIILDCANGSAFKSAPKVFKKLGAKVIVLNVKPNGKNINLNCGALYPKNLSIAVKKHKAFGGFAFDGDADRLICIDEKGIIRDGDFFLSSMAFWLKKHGKLKNNVLISTVMANIGVVQSLKSRNIKFVASKVGDRYVIEDMKKHKASLGGEQSGHFIFNDFLPTGDGLLSAVMLLNAVTAENATMSEFMNVISKFPQILISKKVHRKIPIEHLKKTQKLLKQHEEELGTNGRILVRYSGTENILRVMVEGKSLSNIKNIAQNLASSIIKEIKESIK